MRLMVILLSIISISCGKKESTKEVSPSPQLGAPIPPSQQSPIPLPSPQPTPEPEPKPIPPTQTQQPGNQTPSTGNQNPPANQQGGNAPCYPQGGPIVVGNGGGGCAPGAPIPADGQGCYKNDPASCVLENIIAGELNGLRFSRGLPQMFPNFQIAFVARQWSADKVTVAQPLLQADLAASIHLMRLEFGPGNVLFGDGFNGILAGQINILVEYTPGSSSRAIAQAALAAILNSNGIAITTSPAWRSFGVGLVAVGNSQIYATVFFSN